jgi:hypothetical protein
MGRYLILQTVYFAFVSARNLCVVSVACLAKRPQRVRDLSNILFIVLDLFLVILPTVYGTLALFQPYGLYCRDNGNPETFRWWVISVLCLVYGWVYSVLLCIGFTSLPLIVVFWCFYKMQMSEIANEGRLH